MAPERPTTKEVPKMRKRLEATNLVWHIAGTKSIGQRDAYAETRQPSVNLYIRSLRKMILVTPLFKFNKPPFLLLSGPVLRHRSKVFS